MRPYKVAPLFAICSGSSVDLRSPNSCAGRRIGVRVRSFDGLISETGMRFSALRLGTKVCTFLYVDI
jgi:hypothetical protein